MKQFWFYQSPIGELLLVEEYGKLEQLVFPRHHQNREIDPQWVQNKDPFEDVIKQLESYFVGNLKEFSLNINPIGTEFQKQVWHHLLKIPYGTTTYYGELAKKIGNPKASRAIGMANAKNPIPVIVPCHRVIGKNGALTGFVGGLDTKEKLLKLEGAIE